MILKKEAKENTKKKKAKIKNNHTRNSKFEQNLRRRSIDGVPYSPCCKKKKREEKQEHHEIWKATSHLQQARRRCKTYELRPSTRRPSPGFPFSLYPRFEKNGRKNGSVSVGRAMAVDWLSGNNKPSTSQSPQPSTAQEKILTEFSQSYCSAELTLVGTAQKAQKEETSHSLARWWKHCMNCMDCMDCMGFCL